MAKLSPELERLILENVYIGDSRLTDLTSSGRLMSVGFCMECDHLNPPLIAVVDGEVKEVTSYRCSRMASGFTQPNGWCYLFRKDGKDLFIDSDGRIE